MQDNTTQSGAVKAQNTKKFGKHHFGAAFAASVATAVLVLSLAHLSHGLEAMTGDSRIYSVLLAIGIDLGILASETALIIAAVDRIIGVRRWAVPFLVVALLVSAALNARSYTVGKPAGTLEWWGCVGLGCFIPVTVFVLCKVTAVLLVRARRPEPLGELDSLIQELATGRSKAEIAAERGVTVRTVNRKLANVRK